MVQSVGKEHVQLGREMGSIRPAGLQSKWMSETIGRRASSREMVSRRCQLDAWCDG